MGVNGGLKSTPTLSGPMPKAEVSRQTPQSVDLGIHLPVLKHALDGTCASKRLETDAGESRVACLTSG